MSEPIFTTDSFSVIDAEEDFNVLIGRKGWKRLASLAKEKILHSKSIDYNLWYYRILGLINLKYYQNAHQEIMDNFKPSMNLSYELKLLRALLPALKSKNYTETLKELYTLIHENRTSNHDLVRVREQQLFILVANTLLDLEDYSNAIAVFESLSNSDPSNIKLLALVGRVHLQVGDLGNAQLWFNKVEQISAANTSKYNTDLVQLNRAFLEMGKGNWPIASNILMNVISSSPENITALNNLCVTMLYMGKLQESISLFESLILMNAPQTAGVCEPIIFNLTTLHELSSEHGVEKKLRMLENIVKFGGDGFTLDCLKLPPGVGI